MRPHPETKLSLQLQQSLGMKGVLQAHEVTALKPKYLTFYSWLHTVRGTTGNGRVEKGIRGQNYKQGRH